MKLLIDYIGSKSKTGIPSHGGANYTKRVLNSLIEKAPKDVEIIIIWPDGYDPVDEIEKNLRNSDKAHILEMEEIDDTLDIEAGDIIFFPLLRTRRYPLLKKIKTIYPDCRIYLTNHDVRPLDYKPDKYGNYYDKNYVYWVEVLKYLLRAIGYKYYVKRYYAYVDKLFTVSNDALQKMMKITKPKFVNYYYEMTLIENERITEVINEEYILFVSGKVPVKNFARAIESFCRYKEYTDNDTFLYVTGINEKIMTRIMKNKKVNKEIVEKWVKTWDYVDIQLLHDFYSQCKYLLYPSLNEGFGLPVLEAATCGKKALCSYVASIPEVLGAAEIYIDPFSVESITEGMMKMDSLYKPDETFFNKVDLYIRNGEIDMELLVNEILRDNA